MLLSTQNTGITHREYRDVLYIFWQHVSHEIAVCRNPTIYNLTVHPRTVQRTSRRLAILFSLISTLGWGRRLTPRPDRFTPGKETRYPF